jgi:hypothetical protein
MSVKMNKKSKKSVKQEQAAIAQALGNTVEKIADANGGLPVVETNPGEFSTTVGMENAEAAEELAAETLLSQEADETLLQQEIAEEIASGQLVLEDDATDPDAPVAVEVVEAPKTNGRKWVIAVTGDGMGRSRYVTPDGELDAWKFHALQFSTAVEAEQVLPQVKEELAENLTVRVMVFEKAWYESPEEMNAILASKKGKASKGKKTATASTAVAVEADPNEL